MEYPCCSCRTYQVSFPVAGARTVDEAEPVIEAMIGGGGFLEEVHPVKTFVEAGVDSGAMVVAAREKSGTRWGAGRGSRVEVGEAHATGGKLVEDGSLDGTTVTAEVAVAEVVDEQGDDVGQLILGKTGANQQQETKDVRIGFMLFDHQKSLPKKAPPSEKP